HDFRIQLAELEDVSDLDAADDLELAVTGRARIAFEHIAQIRDVRGLRQVTAPVHADVVIVVFVRTNPEVAHTDDSAVDDVRDTGLAWLEANRLRALQRLEQGIRCGFVGRGVTPRPERTEARTECGTHAIERGGPQRRENLRQLARLDFVELMIAAQ